MKVEVALHFDAEVGEGPIWDSNSRELVFIDVTKGSIHRFNPKSSDLQTVNIGMHLGAIGFYDDERYVAAVRDGFATIKKETGEVTYLKRVLSDDGIRFNDGKCTPFGDFVAGTMRYDPKPATASLYLVDSAGTVKTLLEEVGLSNGLCWDTTGEHFYYIDTLSQEIARFSFNSYEKTLTEREVIYSFQASSGSPDGMTIDQDGNLWVALWGGGKVVAISPDGKLIEELPLPVSQPTSVIFGGEDFKSLFITSANYALDELSRAREPLAGSIFVAEVGSSGRAEPVFGVKS